MCHYFINMWLKYRHWKNEFITLIHKSYSRHLIKVLHELLKNYNNFYTQPPIFINIHLNVNTPFQYMDEKCLQPMHAWSLEPTDFTKCFVSCLEPWLAFTVATCLLLVCGSFGFVFNNAKACSVGLRSGDWFGCWRTSHFFTLRNSICTIHFKIHCMNFYQQSNHQ